MRASVDLYSPQGFSTCGRQGALEQAEKNYTENMATATHYSLRPPDGAPVVFRFN